MVDFEHPFLTQSFLTKRALRALVVWVTLLSAWSLHAQDKRAVEDYEQGMYSAVLDHYTRNFKKGLSSADIRLMCKSMLRLGLNRDGLDLVQEAYLKHPDDPELILALSEALLYNGQYSTAYYLLEEHDELDADPDELYALAKRAAILNQWSSREATYVVSPLTEFNTAKNEFSLLIKDGQRIFCSSQQRDERNNEQYDKGKKEYTSLFIADGDTSLHRPFSGGKFKGKFNIGPFEYSGEHFYFTFSEELRPGENQLQILRCKANAPTLVNAEPVLNIPREYSVAHPTFTPDGKRMIYAADLPGGEGGMDLYYSVMTINGWSSPLSMGDVVNTAGNEVFPRLIDGQLYFSSNGHPGYGGLDIYVVTDDMHREDLRNLYAPINSPYDDFGYLRTGEASGYFSSNRPGGKGGDDIYRYDKRKVEPDMRLISGIIEVEGIPQKNVKMVLTDDQGTIIEQAYTDINGVFYFNRDPEGGKFNIRMDAEENTVKEVDLFLTDADGNKGKKIKADAEGNFVFELLALDDYFIDRLDFEDNTLFAFTMRAQLYRKKPGDLQELINVSMLNQRGIIKKEAESTDYGFLQFKDVVPEDRYWFHADYPDEKQDLHMAILDDNDQIIMILEQDENGRFVYDRPFEEGQFISLYNEDMDLMMVEKDAAINLPEILYDSESWELKEQSKVELDKLIGILKNNAGLKIELSSHTDSNGLARYNADLSTKRAKEAWSYIISRGIDPDRVLAIGKGESEPVNSCRDGVRCNEEEHALNRRTEFRIISN